MTNEVGRSRRKLSPSRGESKGKREERRNIPHVPFFLWLLAGDEIKRAVDRVFGESRGGVISV